MKPIFIVVTVYSCQIQHLIPSMHIPPIITCLHRTFPSESIGSIEITHNDHKPNPNKDNKGADHLNTEYDDPIIMLKLRKHRTILVSEHVDHTSRITSLDNNIKPNKLNKTIKHDIEPNRPSHYMISKYTTKPTL